MSSKGYGLQKEREVKRLLIEQGAMFAQRQRGSFGVFDVIGYWPEHCMLVSVKATKQKVYSPGAELKRIKETKVPLYCFKQLWIWYSPRKDREQRGWKIYDVE